MTAATQEQIEAIAQVQEQMPDQFHIILHMIAANADTDRRAAIARGASATREENSGRAQVWLEVQELMAGAADLFKTLKEREQERDEGFSGPYEEPLAGGFPHSAIPTGHPRIVGTDF